MRKETLIPFMFGACISVQAQTFTLQSSDVGGQATELQVYDGFGCNGRNQSPQLSWTSPPAGTKSFAITMHDPDAPTGSGWWHWMVYDIPATVADLPSGAGTPGRGGMPTGAKQGLTDFGTTGYGGPCPPIGHGLHRYIITVHALGIEKLDVNERAGPAMIGYNINANTIGKASIIFHHGR